MVLEASRRSDAVAPPLPEGAPEPSPEPPSVPAPQAAAALQPAGVASLVGRPLSWDGLVFRDGRVVPREAAS
eukprot:13466886-Alexandrium_andersonii.AAC.1